MWRLGIGRITEGLRLLVLVFSGAPGENGVITAKLQARSARRSMYNFAGRTYSRRIY